MTRILVAEDDRDLRILLAEELGPDARLLFAESGKDAIALLASMPEIAAVVTDLDLGEGPSGFDVLRAARTRNPRCVRLLVTGQWHLQLSTPESALVEAMFAKPWVLGTIRLYLSARLR
jgi:CheY-like chemotaxis protein